MTYFDTHPGKGVIGVTLCALLIAWPPAASWLMAVMSLGWGITHLKAAFRGNEHVDVALAEIDRDMASLASEQRLDRLGRAAAGAGSQLDGADLGGYLPGSGGEHPALRG